MIAGTPAAGLPHQPARRAVELDLAGGVGPVAELVLQTLHVEHVAAAVGQHPGDDEAGDALVELGQHQEQVAHRRRREPLVAGQPVGAVRLGDRAGGVGPDVGAALLLRHAHAGDEPALAGRLGQAELVRRRGQARLVARGELRGPAQGRDGGVGHRDRAARGPSRPGSSRRSRRPGGRGRAGRRRLPAHGRAGQAVLDRGPHELVPVGVELDLVDPVAVPVVGAQLRRVLVGHPPHSWACSLPASRPRSASEASVAASACRRQASASTVSPAIGSWPMSGGTWLATSCVGLMIGTVRRPGRPSAPAGGHPAIGRGVRRGRDRDPAERSNGRHTSVRRRHQDRLQQFSVTLRNPPAG